MKLINPARRMTMSLCAVVMVAGCSTPPPTTSRPAPSTSAGVAAAAPSGTNPTPLSAELSRPETSLPAPAPCDEADNARFLCDVVNVEQLISIDDTRWAVGSSAAGGAATPAPLYFINLDTKTATALDPGTVRIAEDKVAYPGCPGPADFTDLQTLGVDYEVVNGRNILTTISHGGAFTIQVFAVNLGGALPALTWIGCVLPPDEHFWPDAVATLPDGGMLVTSLFDPLDPDYVAALNSGAPYGSLGEWHPDSGWKKVYPNTFAGPNGVILSEDHNTLFVANWSGKQVTRVDRTTGATATADMGMLVDNLAWNQDGSKVLVGGQTDTIEQGFGCSGSPDINCDINFAVYALDPTSMEKTLVIGPGTLGVMGGGTGALQDGSTLWITSYRSDRIAMIDYPS